MLISFILLCLTVLATAVGAWTRICALEKRCKSLEQHAHRHGNFHALGECGKVVQPPEACDHGYIDWDECSICNH